MNEEFYILLENGTIGFYNTCEVTTVFINDKEEKNIHNIYTIVVFEDKSNVDIKPKFITKKPINISKELSLGIIKYDITIDKVKEVYQELDKNNLWEYDGKKLEIGNLKRIPRQFVKQDSTKEVPLNVSVKYFPHSYDF